jgi:RHS repeat-associated protein
VAEYHPVENKYYYYTTDQINSTRVVTDDYGTVVYAAAHDPYGGLQQTWVNTFDPVMKFSGKERDAESGLDYFGARYYDHTLYRFLSVDPVIPTRMALYNPQRWNLYGYCLNNLVNYIDLAGADGIKIKVTWRLLRYYYGPEVTRGLLYWGDHFLGHTMELPWLHNEVEKSCV